MSWIKEKDTHVSIGKHKHNKSLDLYDVSIMFRDHDLKAWVEGCSSTDPVAVHDQTVLVKYRQVRTLHNGAYTCAYITNQSVATLGTHEF